MRLIRRSMLTGIIRHRELPVTEEQMEAWINGALIQDAMPHLSDEDREWIMTGSTKEEFEEAFGDVELGEEQPGDRDDGILTIDMSDTDGFINTMEQVFGPLAHR